MIILNHIPFAEQNALWLLFSGKESGFMYGDSHYRWRHPTERTVLNQLYELYQREGMVMPYTMEDFERDFTKEHLHLLPPDERLRGLPPEERLKGLPPDERLKGLPLEVIEAYLSKLKKSD